MSEFIVADFEWNEQVFVPAGDGEPPGWKLMRDLAVGELGRHAQGRAEAAALQAERARRYRALIDQACDRAGDPDALISRVLTGEELSELRSLKLALDATIREQDRRQDAIDRDMRAGRYRVLFGEQRL
jgi:hypothetical protein